MILRNGRNGQFYGCSAYGRTKCNGTMSYRPEKKEIVKVAPATNVVGSVEQENIWSTIKTGTKNLIVEAVAGSGKTFTVVHSLTCLIGKKVIFTAFNSHIADELAQRVPEGIQASTLHRFGFAQLRIRFPGIKLDKHKLDDIIESLVPKDKEDRDNESRNVFVRTAVKRLVQLVKYNLLKPTDYAALDELVEYHNIDLNDSVNEIYTLVNTAFKMSVQNTKKIDFDDMIYFIFAHSVSVEQFDVFIGDEIQDWNKMQQYLALQAIKNNGRFIGVGDRNQSIYGFAGADINSIPNMIELLSKTTRKVESLPLNQTRRCPKSHVSIAQQFVPHLSALDTAKDGTVKEMKLDQAIDTMAAGNMGICRRNAPLINVAYKLLLAGKTAIVKGRDIGQGLISLINRLKAHTIAELINKAETYRTKELEKLEAKGNKAESQIVALNDRIDTLVALTEGLESIDALIRKIQVLFSDDNVENAIILSSVHRAKGLESDTVYIIDHDRLMIPMTQEWSQQQEQNLAYVAYTRSKDTLVLVESEKRKK